MTDALIPAAPLPLADARERAIRLLTDRYADDTLSTAEFELRLDQLYQTTTPAAVEALVVDLAAPRAVAPARTAPTYVAPAYAAPTQAIAMQDPSVARPDRLVCLFAHRTVGGSWTPGERGYVLAAFSEVTFDLRSAALGNGCDLELEAYFASVQVLLPPHAVLDLNVGAVLGSVADDTTPALGAGPRVRLRGSAAFSEVTIRRAPAELPPDAPFKLAWKEAKRAFRRARSAAG
ncbi:MAG: DUF1707 SHOCT-like domain-containing protein [Gemmatirosa sp.]